MKYALFIDAGYLLSTAATYLTGQSDRSRVFAHFDTLLKALRNVGSGEYLRTYWYDASVDRIPNSAHRELSSYPGVTLRLGDIINNRQKGVDSRIVRDLIVSAYNRTIDTAYILSGDQDILEGIIEAKNLGVRITLMLLEGANVSSTLIQEADDACQLSLEELGFERNVRYEDYKATSRN